MKSCAAICLICLLSGMLQAQPPSGSAYLSKMPPGQLKEDLSLLRKILEANHPSLYWYTPKAQIDSSFDQAIANLTDSLDELQFKNITARIISLIRCGHTSVRFSKKYAKKADTFLYPQFPLVLKAWDDSLVVLGSLNPRDTLFKRGTIITGINGRSNREILDTIFPYMVSDGFAINHKYQVLSGNFPAWYKTIIGLDSSYQIRYIDKNGREDSALVRNYSPAKKVADDSVVNTQLTRVTPGRKQKRAAIRTMIIDTALHTATIRLSSFNGSLRGFFRRSFRTLKKQNIQSLVIDLRENGGGKVRNSIRLARYLTDHPFKIGDSVIAISRKFEYGKYIKPLLNYWLAMNLGAKKMDDGIIHYRYYEQKAFQPLTRFHYSGNVYLVQGGYTFSAASMFVSYLKGQSNVTLVGEETGGGYYGNSAMHIPTITLPHSGLQISLPLYRLVMDKNRPRGRGVIPDISVMPSSQAIKNGIDPKMAKIRELIQQKSFRLNHGIDQ